MKKKILVIVAHPDDEIIGCGGTLMKHISQGDRVKICFAMNGDYPRKLINKKYSLELIRYKTATKISKLLKFDPPEFFKFNGLCLTSEDKLHLNQKVSKIIKLYRPNIVYTHFEGDNHLDHRNVFESVIVSTRPSDNISIEKIYSMEIASATDYPLSKYFIPNHFVDISKFYKKKENILKLYKKEIKKYPNIRSLGSIKNLNALRGNMINQNFSESFKLIKSIW